MARSKWIEQQPFAGKTAMITGGSQGIGLAVAKDVVRLGGSVCIIAIDRLTEAKREAELLAANESQFVETVLCDATDPDSLKPLVAQIIEQRGVPDYLFNFVGYAFAQNIESMCVDDFRRNMNVNFYGQLVPTLAVLPYYLEEGRGGHISFTSSVMGCFGIMGYAAYAPTKHALVGLAEVLRNELKPFSIGVSVLYPPDTKTPGFERENDTKPPECAMLSEGAELLEPEYVAKTFLQGVLKNRFQILPGRAKLYWRLFRYFPGLMRIVLDREYAKARKKLRSP